MNKLLFAAFAVLIIILVIFNIHTGKAAEAGRTARHTAIAASAHPTIVYQDDHRYSVNGSR